MDNMKRLVLYAVLALFAVLLWNNWMRDYPPTPTAAQSSTQASAAAKNQTTGNAAQNSNHYTPPSFEAGTKAPTHLNKKSAEALGVASVKQQQLIWVTTDVLKVAINPNGGNIVEADLLKYKKKIGSDQPVKILNPSPAKLYVAQSGITENSNKTIQFSSVKRQYRLSADQQQLQVILTGRGAKGVLVTKTYIFKRDHYAIALKTQLKNTSNTPWKGSFYQQITLRNVPANTSSLHSNAYHGGAISTPDTPYQKISFSDMSESNLSKVSLGGWVAMQQKYFLSAWVPGNQKQNYRYFSHMRGNPNNDDGENNIFTLGYVNPQITIKPGASVSDQATLYVGPELTDRLATIAKGLDLTIDYGFLSPISVAIFWAMKKIHWLVGNWGLTIILVTLLIKILFYWFSQKSYVSMAKMRELQPRLQTLKERYGDDRQAMGKATMDLYRKEKVNPMGGCLPMLVQIPVFIALYYVLIESVQLRQAPFIFWIHDLSVKDPYYILPILMGLSMFLQQKLSPAPPDPMQAKVMMILPVVFTIFFLNFPAGLVLYWLTNNCLSILQQWYVMKTYDPKAERHKKKNKKSKSR